MPSSSRLATLRSAAMIMVCAGTLCAVSAAQQHGHAAKAVAPTTLFVSTSGKADYNTVQAAVDAAPDTGAVIVVAPGSYREIVTIHKPNITLRGGGTDPSKTVIVNNHSAGENGGTLHSSTVNVYADGFHADHITFENDFNKTHQQRAVGSQALALLLTGDRADLRHVRLLGNQDTLFAGHMGGCQNDGNPCCGKTGMATCSPARSYFKQCYIEGNVDFIFGDGAAVFDHCEIHTTSKGAHSNGGYLTAQSRNSAADKSSVYVFNHCTLTADAGTGPTYLGRPWRDYARVVYLHTTIGAHIDPAGWHEWHASNPPASDDTHRLQTAYFAEYDSSGPGATPGRIAQREKFSHQLTAAQAKAFATQAVLSGPDHWDPEDAQ